MAQRQQGRGVFQGFWTEAFISSIRLKLWKDLDIVAGVGCVAEPVNILNEARK